MSGPPQPFLANSQIPARERCSPMLLFGACQWTRFRTCVQTRSFRSGVLAGPHRPDVTAKGNPAECGVRRTEAIHHAAGGPSTDVTGRFVSSGCSAGRDVNCGKRLARPCQGPLVLPCPAPQRTGSGAPPPGSHLEAPVEPTSPDGCGEGRIRLLGRCGRGNITTESCVMTILPCRVRTQRGFPTPTAHDSSRRRCSDPRR